MSCLRLNLVYEYLEGALDAATQAKVKTHLARCPACRAAVEERRRIHIASFGLPALEVPPNFARQVMAYLDASRSPAFAWLAAVVGSLAGVFLTFLAYIFITGQSFIGVLTSALDSLGKVAQLSLVWLGKVVKLVAVALPLLWDLGQGLVKAAGQLASSAGPGVFVPASFVLLLLMALTAFGLRRKFFAGERP